MNIPIPQVTVLMPTFEQCHFIRRALDSLLAQDLKEWELIIVDDGSQDATGAAVLPYLDDPRISYLKLLHNTGLGQTINEGLARARAPLIAYLPSDDVYYRAHLQQLRDTLACAPDAALAFSGMRHHYNRRCEGAAPGHALQLVQCMHRRGEARWTTRAELESDDLERLFWSRLRPLGQFAGTGSVSCEWVDHPGQRHKAMQEPQGGINVFRRRYRVAQPLRFHATTGNAIDEVDQYRADRERADTPAAPDGLKILLVGELAYNADRVLVLEERGHTLHGLWMDEPYWYNTVGPLPFGHVTDLPRTHWRDAIRSLKPDLIYAQLNWQAVPFCHQVLMATPGIPFVWHFKEGPFICMEKGSWAQLLQLFKFADGRIFSSPEMRDWIDTVVPGLSRNRLCHVLDGDLPRRHWFDRPRSTRLSLADGAIHTVVPGRPIGLHPHTVAELAAHNVHLHFYGDFTQGQWRGWIADARVLAPHHLHLHANVDAAQWVAEFSQYDAGWLHAFASDNGGEIRRANWDDLNYPARMATLVAAGLPMIQRRNDGAIVAMQALARSLEIGIFYDTVGELCAALRDEARMEGQREQVWRTRDLFTFEHHVAGLETFFREVIAHAGRARSAA